MIFLPLFLLAVEIMPPQVFRKPRTTHTTVKLSRDGYLQCFRQIVCCILLFECYRKTIGKRFLKDTSKNYRYFVRLSICDKFVPIFLSSDLDWITGGSARCWRYSPKVCCRTIPGSAWNDNLRPFCLLLGFACSEKAYCR